MPPRPACIASRSGGGGPLSRLEAVEGHEQVAHPVGRRQALGEAREIVDQPVERAWTATNAAAAWVTSPSSMVPWM